MSELTPTNPPPHPPVPSGWYHDPKSGLQRWWDGNQWTEHFAPAATQQVLVMNKGTNHVFHLIMSIITFGLWIPVWIIVAIANS